MISRGRVTTASSLQVRRIQESLARRLAEQRRRLSCEVLEALEAGEGDGGGEEEDDLWSEDYLEADHALEQDERLHFIQ